MKVLFIDRGVGADLYVNPTVTDEQYKALVAYLDAAQPLPPPVTHIGKVISPAGLNLRATPGGDVIGSVYRGATVVIESQVSGFAKITAVVSASPDLLQIVK